MKKVPRPTRVVTYRRYGIPALILEGKWLTEKYRLSIGDLVDIDYQQDLRELAQDYGNTIYDTRKSIKTVDDSGALSQVRKIDSAIRDVLNTNNPDYAQINKVYTLNSRLFDVLDETAKRQESRPLISWFNAIVGSGGATAGGTAGGFVAGPAGSTVGSLAGGGLAVGLTTALNSTWYNTLRAVQKANLADKLTEVGSLEGAKYWVRILNSEGIKGVNQLLNTPTQQLDQVPAQTQDQPPTQPQAGP